MELPNLKWGLKEFGYPDQNELNQRSKIYTCMLRKDIKFMLPIDLLNCSGRRSSCALLKGIWIILIDSMIQATNSLLMDLFETVICANKILIVYIFKSIFTPL